MEIVMEDTKNICFSPNDQFYHKSLCYNSEEAFHKKVDWWAKSYAIRTQFDLIE